MFAQLVADGDEVGVVETDESGFRTFCHQFQKLLGGKHRLVVDGNFSFYLEPSVLRFQLDIPVRHLWRFESHLLAFGPFEHEFVGVLLYEAQQSEQFFGINLGRFFVVDGVAEVVVVHESLQNLRVIALAPDVAVHLIAHAILFGDAGVDTLSGYEIIDTIGERFGVTIHHEDIAHARRRKYLNAEPGLSFTLFKGGTAFHKIAVYLHDVAYLG